MKLSKLTKRIENLEKIKEIIEISKFDALQKLNKATKTRKYHFSIVKESLEILSFINYKYHLKTPFIKNKVKNDKRVLWVYLTISSLGLKISYKKYKKMILEKIIPENDKILAIGQEAKDFAKKNDLQVFKYFDSFENNVSNIIALLNGIAFSEMFDEIKLVTYSLQISKQSPQVLFPIKVEKKDFDQSALRKLRFYPSVHKMVESLSNSFISNLVNTIFQESYEYFYRSKLLKNEESLTNIKNILDNIKKEINKLKRKKATSELMHIGQILNPENK